MLLIEKLLRGRRSLQARMYIVLAPTVCFILSSLAIAAVLTIHFLTEPHLYPSNHNNLIWNTIAIVGLFEFFGVLIVLYAIFLISKRIAKPIAELSNSALNITESGGELLPTDQEISELHDLSTAFNRLISEQQRRLAEMSEFSSNLLHDVKTPLANIRNDAESALNGDTDRESALHGICESSDYLLLAVATNADIAAIASGMNRETSEDVNFSEQLRTAIEIYHFYADNKNITLTADIPKTDIHIRALRLRIQQLVSNLIDNAIKFTPSGGHVDVRLEKIGSEIRLTVADTGIGMTKDEKARAFERFYRSDKSRHTPGFGLGLSLVDAIVSFYNGKIEIESTPNSGTTFTIAFPG